MNLYEAAKLRHSNRKYIMEALDDKLYKEIKEHILAFFPLFDDVNYSIDIINALEDRRYLGITSVKAPYYICVNSGTDAKSLLNAGYMLENCAVYLTLKGISSCFVGMFGTKLLEKDGMKPVILLAFGNSKEIAFREDKYAKRLPVEKITYGYENATEVQKMMADMVRLAPSAFNSQPWRLALNSDCIDIFIHESIKTKGKMGMLDIGIAIANIYIVAEEKWQDVHVLLNNINQIYFLKSKYVCSIALNKGENTL